MTKDELEFELTKIIAIRHIGWEIGPCMEKAHTWSAKVMERWPSLFPGEKIEKSKATEDLNWKPDVRGRPVQSGRSVTRGGR